MRTGVALLIGLAVAAGYVAKAQACVRRAEDEKRRQREEFEAVTRQAAHALRNPLTPIKARAEMLKSRLAGRPDDLRQVDAILRSVDKMDELIGKLSASYRVVR